MNTAETKVNKSRSSYHIHFTRKNNEDLVTVD